MAARSRPSADHEHLLAALRDELGVISPKDGCSPIGQCGCCTVLVDGKARVVVPDRRWRRPTAPRSSPSRASTPTSATAWPAAFAAHGALQCGFCTPGIVMRTKAMIDKKGADLTRDEARPAARRPPVPLHRLHQDPRRRRGAGRRRDARWRSLPKGVGSGASSTRPPSSSLGDRPFIDDMAPDGPAARRVPSRRPRPGRHRRHRHHAPPRPCPASRPVFTAADVPGELRVGPHPQGLAGRSSPSAAAPAISATCWPIVVAEDRPTARRPRPLDRRHLRRARADHRTRRGDRARTRTPCGSSTATSCRRPTYARGDVDAALAAAAHVVRETFQTQRIDHAFLEPESTLAVPSGRSRSAHRRRTAATGRLRSPDGLLRRPGHLGRPQRHRPDPRCRPPTRSSPSWSPTAARSAARRTCPTRAQTALAAWLLQRPVKTTFSREESFLVHTKRHPIRMEYEAGCDADGRLTALHVRMIGDSGPYASVGMKVLERAAGHASGPYVVPNIDVRGDRGPHQQLRSVARSAASVPTRPSSPWRA